MCIGMSVGVCDRDRDRDRDRGSSRQGLCMGDRYRIWEVHRDACRCV